MDRASHNFRVYNFSLQYGHAGNQADQAHCHAGGARESCARRANPRHVPLRGDARSIGDREEAGRTAVRPAAPGFEPTALCRAIIAKGGELLPKTDELAAIVAQPGNQPRDRTIISAGPEALDTIVDPAIAMLPSRQPAAQAWTFSAGWLGSAA